MRFATSVQRSIVIALVLLLAGGCKEFRLRALNSQDAPPDSKIDTAKKAATADSSPESAPDTPLYRDGWNAVFEPVPPLEGYRWRHRQLEALLDLPPEERPDLAAALISSNANAAVNAAILLARAGDDSGRQRLLECVRTSAARLPLRCACAEALAALRVSSTVGDLRELLDRYGQFPSEAYVPDLHAELLYGLAAHVDAGGDPRFAAAAKSPAAQVRLAAVRGWLRPGDTPLADAAADLRTDSDARVRAAALAALAARHQPLALEAARSALTDFRLEVRLAAIEALGEVGGDEAEQALVRLDREAEIIRAAALVALGKLGARERVWAGAESESWHVRKAAVQALRAWPDAGGVLLARRLLNDPSIEVQRELFVTLAAWPLETSGPVLLEAMGGVGYLSRKTAALQLAERWPAAREFTVDAPPERRAEMLVALRKQWSEQHGAASLVAATKGAAPVATSASLDERIERAAELVRRLQEAPSAGGRAAVALHDLAAFGPDLPGVLERLIEERHVVLPDAVYHDVLPSFGKTFVAIDDLASPDVQERRRAANQLAALADEAPLGGLALLRLSELGANESDTLVLNALFRAISNDAREPAVRLAYAGLGHGAAEVRRLAAVYLAAHPSPEHARLLLEALNDTSYAVVLASVRALGHPDMLKDPAPLEHLLTTTDRRLRLAVANSLAQLGAASGPQTLELLAKDSDPETRQKAAQLMGELGNQSYMETLINLLSDDTLGVRLAALDALGQVAGRDVTADAENPPTSTLDRIERWKRWWSQTSSKPASD